MLYILRNHRQVALFISILLPLSLLFKTYPNNLTDSSLTLGFLYTTFQSNFVNSLVFLSAYYVMLVIVQYTLNSYNLTTSYNYFALLFTGILYVVLIKSPYITPSLLSAILWVYIIRKLIKSFHDSTLSYEYYDMGLICAVSILVNFNSIYLIPLIYIGHVLFRTYNWREWTFPLVGILTVYLIIISIRYLFDSQDVFLIQKTASAIQLKPDYLTFTPRLVFFLIAVIINITAASLFTIKELLGKKILQRRFYIFLLWFFLIALITYITVKSPVQHLIFVIIPTAYLLTHFYSTCRKTILNEVILDILVLAFIINLL